MEDGSPPKPHALCGRNIPLYMKLMSESKKVYAIPKVSYYEIY